MKDRKLMYAVRIPTAVRGTNRIGQSCEALRIKNNLVHVRFGDGAEALLSRYMLRPRPVSGIVLPHL